MKWILNIIYNVFCMDFKMLTKDKGVKGKDKIKRWKFLEFFQTVHFSFNLAIVF